MSLVGCARVSTEDQATDAKVDALTAGGSAVIFREHMSGAKASRPELLKALGKIQRGDMLVMATLVALTSLMRNEFWENQCLMKFSDLWILTSIVRISLGR